MERWLPWAGGRGEEQLGFNESSFNFAKWASSRDLFHSANIPNTAEPLSHTLKSSQDDKWNVMSFFLPQYKENSLHTCHCFFLGKWFLIFVEVYSKTRSLSMIFAGLIFNILADQRFRYSVVNTKPHIAFLTLGPWRDDGFCLLSVCFLMD